MNLGLSSAPKAQVVYSPLWCGASGPTNKGASFVEIYQNCIVYNDDVFAPFTEKKAAPANQIWLENGKPMLFAGGLKGLTLDRQALKLEDRKSVVSGKSVSVRVDLGGRRRINNTRTDITCESI